MTRLACLPLLAFVLGSCMGSGEGQPPAESVSASRAVAADLSRQADRTFVVGERFGMITSGMPPGTIENIYGSENLVATKVDTGEGELEAGYILFPGTRDEARVILSRDGQPRRFIITQSQSRWTSAAFNGLRMGMNLGELTEVNGGPFTFSGFGWDYGGTVTDWRGGKLTGTVVRLRYASSRLGSEGLPPALLGDVTISSRDSLVADIGLSVREIVVDLGKP